MKKKVMSRAWRLARQGAEKFGGSAKEYFAISLKMAWAEVKAEEAVAEEKEEAIDEKFLEKISINVEEAVSSLPAITVGSPKQIAWAENIRKNAYMCLNNIITSAVVLGYNDMQRKLPIFIDKDRYENGSECYMGRGKYNGKKIVEAAHYVKAQFLDKFFAEKWTTAPQVIDNRYDFFDKEMKDYVKNCYSHMA